MKKLLMGLMLVSSMAQAEWVLYGDNGKAEFYYDDKTINTSGSTVSVWEMLSYSFPLNGVLSNRSHKEYKCEAREFRNLSGEFFSEPYLKGNKVSSNDSEDGWRPVVDGTRNSELLDIVCGKRS
ncbi:MAG: surface-adhesin E family protein [Burkholderiaceae bacterium]